MRNLYTAKEDENLIKYVAEARPQPAGRQGNRIYQILVENRDRWPWARTHSWQSWRDHYQANKEEFDERIVRYQRQQNRDLGEQSELFPPQTQRNPFTDNEDKLLVKYLATYNPQIKGRNGNQVYKKLVENAEGKWKWSKTHSWHSWRHRYVSNQDHFDQEIAKYQARRNITTSPSRLERPTKRPKVTEGDSQEHEWAKLDWTLRRDHVPNGSTSRGDDPEETKPVVAEEKKPVVVEGKKPLVVEGKKPVVVEEPIPEKPPAESTKAEESQAEDSGDEGPPPGSEDYGGEVFPGSDEDENGDQRNSVVGDSEQLDEGEDGEDTQDEDSGEVHLNGGTSTALTIGKLVSNGLLNTPPPESKPAIKPEPTSPRFLPKPPPPKFLAVGSHSDFTFSSQYKPRRPRRDDDPFEDYQSPPPESQPKTKAVEKSPPKLLEGPYGNRLIGVRVRNLEGSSTEGDEDTDTPWPPPRGVTSKLRTLNGTNAKPRKPRGGYLNGVVAEQRHRDKGKGKAREDDDERNIYSEADGPFSAMIHENEPDSRQVTTSPLRSKATAAQGSSIGPAPSQISTLKRRRTDIFLRPTPLEASAQKRHSTGDLADHTTPRSIVSANTNPSNSRIINFRQELGNKNVHQPTTHRAVSHTSRASSVISEEDHQIFQQLGIQQAIRMLSEQFGFTEAIVQRLWNQLKNLRLLKDALSEMRDSADRKMSEWIEGASRISSQGQSPVLSVFQVAKTRTPTVLATPGSMVHTSRPSSSPKRRRRYSSIGAGMKSLEIKPVDMQDVSAAMELEYEPLTGTRAGKYTRLAKMGREDEALEREQRRVSSIALSPRRDLLQQQQQEQEQPRDEQDAEREEVEKEIATEIYDEEEGTRDEDMRGIHPEDDEKGEGHDDNRSSEQEDHAMEVDSALSDQRDQRPPTDLDSPGHDRERERDPKFEDQAEALMVQEELHESGALQSQVEDLDEDEQTISSNIDSLRISEVENPIKTDVERWKEVEPLFRAANRKNVETLKELERTFDPGFLMEWLGNQVALK